MNSDGTSSNKPKPLVDPTINYGHVLTAVSFIVAGAGAHYGMRAELKSVDRRVAKIENTLQQLANVLVLTARQDDLLPSSGESTGWSSHPDIDDAATIAYRADCVKVGLQLAG